MPDNTTPVRNTRQEPRGGARASVVREAKEYQIISENVSCFSVFSAIKQKYTEELSNNNIEYSGGIPYLDKMSNSASLSEAAREVTSDTVITSLGRLTPEQLAAVIGDSTVGQLQEKYDRLRDLVMPTDKIHTPQQYQQITLLSNTYTNLQKRRKELGLDPLPDDKRIPKARTLLRNESRQWSTTPKADFG